MQNNDEMIVTFTEGFRPGRTLRLSSCLLALSPSLSLAFRLPSSCVIRWRRPARSPSHFLQAPGSHNRLS